MTATDSTTTFPIYRQITCAAGTGSAPARRVPVLFSTNRGLYLRVAQSQQVTPQVDSQQRYDISFCDLERWSTNRANIISLEDTFGMLQPQPQPPWNHYGAYNVNHN